MTSITFVQALYSFKGKNNDELCFKKGDVITLTQKIDGGWWEGTLNEKTGWFPSNYVKEVSDVQSPIMSPLSQKRQFYSIVLHDLTESETKFVNELQTFINSYLNAIEKSSILNSHEYRQLTGNILELFDVHKSFLCSLEENETKPFTEQRTGKLFLACAPKFQNVHQTYCSLHPKAACVLDKFKDQLGSLMETSGANCPGIIVLTTGLSKPFRRLDKYPGILQELERHIDENHQDRGDIQRSAAIFNDITSICTATRKQKELELQVLTGPVRGWDGASLAQLGDIVHMGSVAIGPQNLDRYFVLFAHHLLILSVSQRMSAFIYEGKLPVSGLDVKRVEDSEMYKNAFELHGPMSDPITAVCQTKAEAQYWLEVLRPSTGPAKNSIYSGSSDKSETLKCPISERKSADKSFGLFYGLRPNVSERQTNATARNLTDEQDLSILRVIEAYCNSSSGTRTNSGSESATARDQSISELSEQTLVQNVLLIQEQIRELQKNFSQLKTELRDEQSGLKKSPSSSSSSLPSTSQDRHSTKTLTPDILI